MMDESRRRYLMQSSSLGKAIVREQDKATEAGYQRAKDAVYQQHPNAAGRRQQLLSASPLGRAVLEHERQLRQADG